MSRRVEANVPIQDMRRTTKILLAILPRLKEHRAQKRTQFERGMWRGRDGKDLLSSKRGVANWWSLRLESTRQICSCDNPVFSLADTEVWKDRRFDSYFIVLRRGSSQAPIAFNHRKPDVDPKVPKWWLCQMPMDALRYLRSPSLESWDWDQAVSLQDSSFQGQC